jgi:hypothetical protein
VRIAVGVVFCLLLGTLIYGLGRPAVRIARVVVYGADQSLADVATNAMQGDYLGVIPRDSTLFFPADSIRESIIEMHPDIAAVSIFRNGLTGLSIRIDYRVPIARWCGLAPTEGVEEYCYLFDANGFIFSAFSSGSTATSSQTVNSFALYAPLEGDTLEPFRATIAHAPLLPSVFDFARQLATLGSPVTWVILRGDEVSVHLANSARVTYVLGSEEDSYTALMSARENFELAGDTVEYVDLRFPGKVYLKKK